LAAWIAAALGFLIPFSTAAANIFLLLLLITWLVMPERVRRLRLFWGNRLARLALILFLALALGCLWGEVPMAERLRMLFKYGDLLLVGVMVGSLPEAEQRKRVLSGFVSGMGLLLLLSMAKWLGILPEGTFGKVGAGAVVMKLSITHGWLMACFAGVAAIGACYCQNRLWRRMAALVAVLASLNVLFMVGGRTGYVVLAVLVAYGFFAWKSWRGLALAVLFVGTVGAASLAVSPGLSKRVNEAVSDVMQWKPGLGSATSQGLRLDWYRASLALIAEKPLLGVGTGSFQHAVKSHLPWKDAIAPHNPHNDYLMFAVQLGLPGLVLLLSFLVLCWRSAAELQPRDRHLLRGMVLAMAIGCLFNCFFSDFTEGLFFAWMIGLLAAGLSPDEKNAALASRV